MHSKNTICRGVTGTAHHMQAHIHSFIQSSTTTTAIEIGLLVAGGARHSTTYGVFAMRALPVTPR
jgi:hypothetical protein